MPQIIFKSIPVQKTVLDGLKTWYFPYSAFWLAIQWGAITTPSPPFLATLLLVCRTTMPNVDVQLNEYVMSNRARTLIAQNAYILRFSPLPYWHML